MLWKDSPLSLFSTKPAILLVPFQAHLKAFTLVYGPMGVTEQGLESKGNMAVGSKNVEHIRKTARCGPGFDWPVYSSHHLHQSVKSLNLRMCKQPCGVAYLENDFGLFGASIIHIDTENHRNSQAQKRNSWREEKSVRLGILSHPNCPVLNNFYFE